MRDKGDTPQPEERGARSKADSPTAKNQKRPERLADCVFGFLVARPNCDNNLCV